VLGEGEFSQRGELLILGCNEIVRELQALLGLNEVARHGGDHVLAHRELVAEEHDVAPQLPDRHVARLGHRGFLHHSHRGQRAGVMVIQTCFGDGQKRE
jgi:hypothetical protein